ncbi:glycosyltransferase family 2 protein [Kineococcus sp. TBRC 1896]|uniref:Glycosyltransferase family 2 protein n=1 Tax=Kineococcus mangrovi TaxID=1660183 RepID=A0ABV4I9U3_9ACTN
MSKVLPARAAEERSAGDRAPSHSLIAGAVEEPAAGPEGFRPRWRHLSGHHGRHRRTLLLAVLNICFELGFAVWLLWPTHYPRVVDSTPLLVANIAVICAVATVELLRLVNVVSLSVASVIARDPVPVTAPRDLRLAFVTSFVPGKEPLEMLEGTLRSIRSVQDPTGGGIDSWVLDEGNDPQVRALCAALGVHHFSRHGVARYNQPGGTFKARSKHGNYNAWFDAVGYEQYDVMLSVDTDHRPTPNYAERILGPFHDPDVAFVVGPQDYGNSTAGFVPMGAESQQFPFHSVIQRAANTYSAAMLVGTNNALRLSALRAIGGLKDSVTEDMATGLVFHTSKNPTTGRRWRSVYTPDVLAVGEGPTSWGDFFSQQDRWSRGTFEVLLKDMWRLAWKLRPGHLLHYSLITTFYPSMAVAWLLGAVCVMVQAVVGAGGLSVPPQVWLALFLDATLFQLWLYVANRRYNVSPFERQGSFGLSGMLMSVFAAPIYAGSFLKTVFRRPARFAVTPKGGQAGVDGWFTFRVQLFWLAWFSVAVVLSLALGHATPASLLWPLVSTAVLLAPVLIARRERRASARTPEVPGGPTVLDLRTERLAPAPRRPVPALATTALTATTREIS